MTIGLLTQMKYISISAMMLFFSVIRNFFMIKTLPQEEACPSLITTITIVYNMIIYKELEKSII